MISELATFWDILPGRADEVRAASKRMTDAIHGLDPATSAATGLRDARIVVFNEGRQLLFATTFETEWDHYIDDAILVVGVGVVPGLDAAHHPGPGDRGLGQGVRGRELRPG